MLTSLLAISLFCFPCVHAAMAKTDTQTLWNEEKKSYGACFEIGEESLPQKKNWEHFKQQIALDASKIPGWCAEEKALYMMDFIKENQCEYCIEIGVFAGASLLPLAKAIQYNGAGLVYAIDAWDPLEAIKGYKMPSPSGTWWHQLDYESLYNQTVNLVKQHELQDYCKIIRQPSQEAVHAFVDATIDFIHIDGNHNEDYVFQDVIAYFPKIKEGGYILLNDANWISMRQALVFLLERCDKVSPFVSTATYFLFRKSSERIRQANLLIENKEF